MTREIARPTRFAAIHHPVPLIVVAGERHPVREDQLARTRYARLVRKGGGEQSSPAVLPRLSVGALVIAI